MKLVIEIDDEYYEIIKHDVEHGNDYKPWILIANGTPLPKCHGDLKDVNVFKANVIRAEHNADGTSALFDATDICRMLDGVPTIIEADKEGETE